MMNKLRMTACLTLIVNCICISLIYVHYINKYTVLKQHVPRNSSNIKKNLTFGVSKERLLSYLQDNKRKNKVHKYCYNSHRPHSKDLLVSHDIWQYAKQDPDLRHVVMGVYYDDRESTFGSCLKLFPLLFLPTGNEPWNGKYSVLLWYKGINEAINVECDYDLQLWSSALWHRDGYEVYMSSIKCLLPDIGIIPTYASLTTKICESHPTIFLPVVLPGESSAKESQVTACVKCLFGNLTKDMAPYVVSWFESMKLFGMQEIFVDEDLDYIDPVIKRIFQFYQHREFLKMRKMSNNIFGIGNSDMISQSVVYPLSNDCFYRNIKRYRYVLHIDLDEVVVPHNNNTYMGVIEDYLNHNPLAENSTSLITLSAPFFKYLQIGNKMAPNFVPILQYTFRTSPERHLNVTKLGSVKSFQSTKTCSSLFIHFCMNAVKGYLNTNRKYMSEQDILVHHFRERCKYRQNACPKNYTNINDKTLWTKYGNNLMYNVRNVLNKVNYFP